jgi:methyl-accepting chemotaxis protein
MAFGLFKKRVPEPALPAAQPKAQPVADATESASADGDSAKAILELLELELGTMIRQLERAASSVAGGAEATAATLSTIRQRTDALTNRTSAAQGTATTFSHAADKFTQSAQGIGAQVRDAGKLADQASDAAREASANVDRLRESSADRAADHAAGAQVHHRGRACRRGRARICGGRHRGEGARGADPARD